MPVVPDDSPCVKGGAVLLGSIEIVYLFILVGVTRGGEVCAVSWHMGTQAAVTHMASDHPSLIYAPQSEQKPLKSVWMGRNLKSQRCWWGDSDHHNMASEVVKACSVLLVVL